MLQTLRLCTRRLNLKIIPCKRDNASPTVVTQYYQFIKFSNFLLHFSSQLCIQHHQLWASSFFLHSRITKILNYARQQLMINCVPQCRHFMILFKHYQSIEFIVLVHHTTHPHFHLFLHRIGPWKVKQSSFFFTTFFMISHKHHK